MEDNVPIDDKRLLRLLAPSAPEPPAKRQCPVVPQHSANGQQIKVQFTGGKIRDEHPGYGEAVHEGLL